MHSQPVKRIRNESRVEGPRANSDEFRDFDRKNVVAAAEKELIIQVLQECCGNRSLAAKQLGCSRSTLYHMLHRHQIEERSYFIIE